MKFWFLLGMFMGCTQPETGYYVCSDDWQGVALSDCRFVDDAPPVEGVTVYYESPYGLKPYVSR